MKVWRLVDDAGEVVASIPLGDVLDPATVARDREGFGIYEAIGATGEILYTGRTGDLAQRLRAHFFQSAWWGFAREIRWTPCANYAEAIAIERLGISTDHGIWNQAGHRELPTGRLELPTAARVRLVALYAACTPMRSVHDLDLNNYIATLRHVGWTLQSIATPLNITRERVRQRAALGAVDFDLVVPRPPRQPEPKRKVWPRLSAEAIAEIQALMPLAVRVRGNTPIGHPNRVASECLSEIFAEARIRGVRIREIAEAAGLTGYAVRARLARHGYIANPPSQPNYRPGSTARGMADRCQRGHRFEGENVRHINGDPKRRVCRTCERERVARYQAKKRSAA